MSQIVSIKNQAELSPNKRPKLRHKTKCIILMAAQSNVNTNNSLLRGPIIIQNSNIQKQIILSHVARQLKLPRSMNSSEKPVFYVFVLYPLQQFGDLAVQAAKKLPSGKYYNEINGVGQLPFDKPARPHKFLLDSEPSQVLSIPGVIKLPMTQQTHSSSAKAAQNPRST